MTKGIFLFVMTITFCSACGSGSTQAACDSANLAGMCNVGSLGQCSDFTGLSTSDRNSVQAFCTANRGDWEAATCATSGRLGTCTIPAEGPNTRITCSPNATVNIRYFAPYTADQAKGLCDGVTGSHWTPN
jgi:hypothetical protein